MTVKHASKEHPLVLGSQSPRRREILETLRVPHVVLVASVDEARLADETPDSYLARVVRAKLDAVLGALPAHLRSTACGVLVADTSVVLNDPVLGQLVLGKPESTVDAALMIMRLSGATHEVHTRFALARVSAGGAEGRAAVTAGELIEETVRTRVTFRTVSRTRALAYAETGEGMDKAGGYAVQGLAAALVSRIDGSYTNVVGLPACEVSVALERLGLA